MTAVIARADNYHNYGAWFKFMKWPGFLMPEEPGGLDNLIWFEAGVHNDILSWIGITEDSDTWPEGYDHTECRIVEDKALYPLAGYYFTLIID